MDWVTIYIVLWVSFQLIASGILNEELQTIRWYHPYFNFAFLLPVYGRVFGWW